MKIIPNTLSRGFHRKAVVLKKESPHIFFGAGLVGFVSTTVLASKATLKLPDTLSAIESNVEEVKRTASDQNEQRRQLARTYAKGSLCVARLYAPAAVVGGLSVASLTGAHVALHRRNTALMAAFHAVNKAFDDYRARVRDEYGEEKELDLYHAASDRKVKGEDGKDVTIKSVNPNLYSQYARIFDESNPNWKRDNEYNRLFLMAQQSYANDLLQSRGHLFLNEVYTMLGFEHSRAGAVVGWVISDQGDNYVDFGMFIGRSIQANGFVNGWEQNFVLDFNVDGVIYDLI